MNNFFKTTLPQIKSCIFKAKYILTLILAIVIIFFSILFIKWIIYKDSIPDKTLYFEESFNQGLDNWKYLDANWKAEDNSELGVVQLSQNKYATPYIQNSLKVSESPLQSFTWRIRLKVSSFNGSAVTLGTLVFPTGQITLVMNYNNQLGVSYNLFDKPTYSQGLFSQLSKDLWYDIYVWVDIDNRNLTVYVGDNEVLTTQYVSSTMPVQEIWLGAIWFEGREHYGAPVDISYSTVSLGNKGLLPRLSFIKYSLNFIRSIFPIL